MIKEEALVPFCLNWLELPELVYINELFKKKPFMLLKWQEQLRNVQIKDDVDLLIETFHTALDFDSIADQEEILPVIIRGRIIIGFDPTYYIRFCDENRLNPIDDLSKKPNNVKNQFDTEYDLATRIPSAFVGIKMRKII